MGATTALGMIPVLADDFFGATAVGVVGGSAFATSLTLLLAPVLFWDFYSGESPEPATASAGRPGGG